MPTRAEAERIAQEDAMMRQIAMQAAQQRAQEQAFQRTEGAANARQDAQVRAAQINADAQLAAIRAQMEGQRGIASDTRQGMIDLRKTPEAMSEGQKAQLDMAKSSPDYIEGQAVAAALQKALGGAPAVTPVPTAQAPMQAAPSKPSAPYDTTGFTADTGRIEKSVDNIRAGAGEFYDEFDPSRQQGAAIRDANGVLRTIYTPGESSSKTRGRIDSAAVKSAMMPTPPIAGITGDGAAATVAPAPVKTDGGLLDRVLEKRYGPTPEVAMEREDKQAMRTDARTALNLLRTGQYTGDIEKATLEGIVTDAGLPLPKAIAMGKTRAIDEVKALDDFTNAEDEFKSIVSGVRGGQSSFGAEDRGAKQAADVARQIRAKAKDIASRTGGNQSLIAKELTAQALANQKGVDPGFFNKWGNMLAETYTLGEAETDREAFMRLLRKEMGLPE